VHEFDKTESSGLITFIWCIRA